MSATQATVMPVGVVLAGGVRGGTYAELSRQIRQAGLLRRRRGYYAARIAVTAAWLAVGWAVFVLVGDSWWQLAVAVWLAVAFMQLGFVGHDAGHQQIFRRRWANNLVGLACGNLGIGLSYAWWMDKHNRHHAHQNQEGRDPDLIVDPVAFTAGQASRRRGLGRLVVRWQGFLFVPLLMLEALNMHVSSVRAVTGRAVRGRLRAVEAVLLALHVGGYLTTVFLVLSPLRAVVFIAVHQALFGLYMGAAFAPNHKGMPVLTADDDCDFLRRQVLTARNVSGGWLVDTALGGLNYQIEHHLFPRMPRPNLRHAQQMIRTFCHLHDLPYVQTSLFGSWAKVLRHLHTIGRRPDTAPQA